ncbi:hypothetical protein O0544_22445 [Edwardsiella anguillarum]|nr:hypothetical protein [Edwardsiella anguillarum]
MVLLTMVGATLGDTTLYFVGRHFGTPILRRFPRQQQKIAYVQRQVRRNESWLIRDALCLWLSHYWPDHYRVCGR